MNRIKYGDVETKTKTKMKKENEVEKSTNHKIAENPYMSTHSL